MSATTPINIDRLSFELRRHNDRQFVNNLISGLRNGFYTGITNPPSLSFECKNLRSTSKFPNDVSRLVDQEVQKGYVIGPFQKPPFHPHRISPIGIVEGKYSGKKRLILDLSAPHNNNDHISINDLIDKDNYSMSYVKIDDAIHIIKELGVNAKCSKTDITDAFKLIPIHPSIWHLYGFKWQNGYYFYTRLSFGCRSSPKIFDQLSIAICWILQNNYSVRNILHLLDDFIIITNANYPAERSFNTMISLFRALNIPLSEKKTVQPTTEIEYLGIILNSVSMLCKLPDDKLVRIKDKLSEFLDKKTCTKRELLSLLGHLHFASRVVLPGRSFVSYLLTLAHSVEELHYRLTLNSDCRKDLNMWFSFLEQWNGVSFFIDSSSDLELYTDASSLIGFAGFCNGQYFQGKWPNLLSVENNDSISMAYRELYPIVVAAVLWGNEWSGKRVLFHCDNMATVQIIKKGRSKSSEVMSLMRRLTWLSAKYSFIVHSKFIPGYKNAIADSLSRFQMDRFHHLVSTDSVTACQCPQHSELIWN